jgi:hypothetical protein
MPWVVTGTWTDLRPYCMRVGHGSDRLAVESVTTRSTSGTARRAGALGGKLLGAGGGGFLLLVAPTLGRRHELPFRIARHGTRLIFVRNLGEFPRSATLDEAIHHSKTARLRPNPPQVVVF